MDYSQSNGTVVHPGTGNRMHQDTGPVPSEVSAKDMNALTWAVMEVLKDAGVGGRQFDADDPTSYRALVDSLDGLFTRKAMADGVVYVLEYLTPEERMNAFLRLGTIDCGANLQRAINAAGGKVLVWAAGYVFGCGRELIVRVTQMWRGGGVGRMLTPFGTANFAITELRTVGHGTAYKTVKTRVRYRGAPTDPQDPPISALVSVQTQGFSIRDMVIRCTYDETLIRRAPVVVDGVVTVPPHLGDDWDVGIFVGCRLHFKPYNVAMVGNWRLAAGYCDVTRSVGLPELVGWDGVQHPADSTCGGDGCHVSDFISWGGKWAWVVKGADPKNGLISYGVDYKVALSATFNAIPLIGDTLTLGDVTFTFKDTVSAGIATDVLIGSTVAETVLNLLDSCVSVIDSDMPAVVFRLGLYLAHGDILQTFCRDPADVRLVGAVTVTEYEFRFSASTSAGGRIVLSASTPQVIADPAPYCDQTPADMSRPAAIPDQRGAYGFSDHKIEDSQLFGSTHPTKWARDKITSATRIGFTGTTVFDWIADTAGGAMYIDGLAGNAARALQGHSYARVRFDGRYDPYCVRLGRTHRDEFFACHWDGSSTTGFFWPDGSVAGLNPDGITYSPRLAKYGPVTRVPGITRRTRFYSRDSTPYSEYFAFDDVGSGNVLDGSGRMQTTGPSIFGGPVLVDRSRYSNGSADFTARGGSAGSARFQFDKGGVLWGALRYYFLTDNLRLSLSGDVNSVLWKRDGTSDTVTQTLTPVGATGTGVYASTGKATLAAGSGDAKVVSGAGAAVRLVAGSSEVVAASSAGLTFSTDGIGTIKSTAADLRLVTQAPWSVQLFQGSTQLLDINSLVAVVGVSGMVRPASDNAVVLGGLGFRWKELFCGNNTINSSDATMKLVRGELTDAEVAAWGRVETVVFQWLSSVQEKGAGGARLQVGYVAQQVAGAFRAEGLDPARYSLWCEDPVMETVVRTRKARRERLRPVMRREERLEFVEGRAIRKVVEVESFEPETELVPLFDESGERALDLSQEPPAPAFVARVVFDEVDEQFEEQVPTGRTVLGLRYEQCASFGLAYLKTVYGKLRADVNALQRQLEELSRNCSSGG